MNASGNNRLRILLRVLALVSLCALLPPPPAFAGEFTGIVFFGDSLSDPGNHFEAHAVMSQKPFIPDPD